MLRKEFADYRWAITQLFTEVDPAGLISGGGPPVDEYEPEISALLKYRSSVVPDHIRQFPGRCSASRWVLYQPRTRRRLRRARGHQAQVRIRQSVSA